MDLQAKYKVGFVGFGNMAHAMAQGFLRAEALRPEEICACAAHWDTLCTKAAALGVVPCQNAGEVVRRADTVIVAIKPYQIETVLAPLADALRGKTLVSVAAGWLYDRYEALLPGVHHLSAMPNTPVSVCEGIVLLEQQHSLTEEEFARVRTLLSSLGLVQTVETRLMGIAGTISGCGPAYAAMFIEALGDAGVRYGLQRQTAYALAAQMLAGTGRLQRETGRHPAAMKDAVCSPGGTTIAGVAALEQSGFCGAVISAIDAVQKRAAEL